jgi:hypothetical protein
LNAEADRAAADALAHAAFESGDRSPPSGTPPGATIEDLARGYSFLKRGLYVDTQAGARPLAPSWRELAADPTAVPLSPLLSDVRAIGVDLRESGERLPLVLEAVEEGSFRAVVAVWADEGGHEIVERAERLEALLGMWNGALIPESQWAEAHAVARHNARALVQAMRDRALVEERAGLRRQIEAAQRRLMRELARFLACAANPNEDFNATFHRAMERGGQVGALLVRAYGLVGYPEWPADLVRSAVQEAERLGANRRTNVLLGTPLQAAVQDPRWTAVATLDALCGNGRCQ